MLLSSRDAGDPTWTVSLQLSGAADGSLLLEAGSPGTDGSAGPCDPHRQLVQDRELAVFPVSMACSDTLEIRLAGRSGETTRTVRIPVARSSGTRRYLVPEIRAWERRDPRRWSAMELTLDTATVVDLAVVDGTGRPLTAWRQGLLEAGRTTVLWDGRDVNGEPAGEGTYRLEVRARPVSPGRPGSP